MKTLRMWFMRLLGSFFQQRREQEFAAEMESNLQMHIDDNVRAGMSPEQARREALLKFGNANSARDSYYQQSGLPFLETLRQDVRYGMRMLRKSPGFTLVAVLTLALGIGANTAIFSVINAVLLRPLPYTDPDRLVQLWETENAPGNYPLTGPDYLDWQAQNTTMEGTSLYAGRGVMNGSGTGETQPVSFIRTQANFFTVMSVNPEIGRTFAPGEDSEGKNHVVVITDGFWKKFFGARSDVIGRTIVLDSIPYEVIGVMPDWFTFPTRSDVWVPLDMSEKSLGRRGTHSYNAIGRIKPGVSIEAARADLHSISKRLAKLYPDNNEKVEAIVVPLKEQITGSSRPQLVLLLIAVAVVLLVACVNVANLLLARATKRQREIALRAVLGASRSRVIRQLLTESVLLALMGAAVGLAGAWWAVVLIRSSKSLPIPRVSSVQLDLTVLAFTALVSMVVGILFGLAPALQASATDLNEDLKSSAQAVVSPLGWKRLLRDGLVVVEIAASLALLAGAGLLLRSFSNMRNSDTGIQPQNVMTTIISLPEKKYNTPESRHSFVDSYLERVQHLPGVQAAALATELPLEGGSNGYVTVEGDKDPAHATLLVESNYITPDYFRALGIPFLHGQNFSAADIEHVNEVNLKIAELVKKNPDLKTLPPELTFVAVINRAMADTYWLNQNPVGKIFNAGVPVRVIGVVGNASVFGIESKPFPQAYYPMTATYDLSFSGMMVVKTSTAPSTIIAPLRNTLTAMDSSLAAFQPRSMDEVVSDATQSTGMQTYLLGSFAGLALLLAAVGLYSVLAYLVTQRTREIGIRMALGAQHKHVMRLVMAHGSRLTAIGVLLGIGAALALTRFMRSLLFGVSAKDPMTFACVVAMLTLVALSACYIPARRAMRVEPMVALRDE
ncbi:MAG TPA: ABC transporter permease [Candidatus Angelobacter sp.]|nr:ABC transporter permease [Candidatus Angelobacter sp.]